MPGCPTCGYAVDWLRSCYSSFWRLHRDDLGRLTLGRYYFVPEGTPMMPVGHHYGSRNWLHPEERGEILGEHATLAQVWDDGSMPDGHIPPAVLLGDPECYQLGERTGGAPPPAQVSGVDVRCWLATGNLPPDGGPVVAPIADQVVVATDFIGVYRAGHITDPEVGPVLVSAGVALDWVQLPEHSGPPEVPPSGSRLLYSDPDGIVLVDPEGVLTRVPALLGTEGTIPRTAGPGSALVDSRLHEHLPAGPVECAAVLWVAGQLVIPSFGGITGPHCMLKSLSTSEMAKLSLSAKDEVEPAVDRACELILETPSLSPPYVSFEWFGTTEIPQLRWQGELAYEGEAYGGIFKGGILIEPYTEPPSPTIAGSYVAPPESTGSSTPVDLTTPQYVTFELSTTTTVWVETTADVSFDTNNGDAVIWAVVDSIEEPLTALSAIAAGKSTPMSGRRIYSLAPGEHTVGLKFSCSLGDATFDRRSLVVRR